MNFRKKNERSLLFHENVHYAARNIQMDLVETESSEIKNHFSSDALNPSWIAFNNR